MKRIVKLVVELDVSELDDWIWDLDQIKDICIEYWNHGEGMDWLESTPFKVLYYETEDGKRIHVG